MTRDEVQRRLFIIEQSREGELADLRMRWERDGVPPDYRVSELLIRVRHLEATIAALVEFVAR